MEKKQVQEKCKVYLLATLYQYENDIMRNIAKMSLIIKDLIEIEKLLIYCNLWIQLY